MKIATTSVTLMAALCTTGLVMAESGSEGQSLDRSQMIAGEATGGGIAGPGAGCDITPGNELYCNPTDQAGHGANGIVGATSDANGPFFVAESVDVQVSGNVNKICWWGIYIDFGGPSDCGAVTPGDDGNLFSVTYYNDDNAGGALPGTLRAGPFFVGDGNPAPSGNVVPTGIGDVVEWAYNAEHPPVAVVAGEKVWVEIFNNTTGACLWLWGTAPTVAEGGLGDGASAQDADSNGYLPGEESDYDLGVCLGTGGTIEPYCPWDLGGDKTVGTPDLLELLANWGNPYGTVDLLALLAAWGPCPAPANDECADKEDISLAEGQDVNVPVDMRGSTPSPEPLLGDCAGPGEWKDVWYCITYTGAVPQLLNITTTLDVTIEVYEDCVCPPAVLKACGFGLPAFGGVQDLLLQPGQSCCVRLINDLDYPNDSLIGRMDLDIKPLPTNETCVEAFDLAVPDDVFGDTTGDVSDPGASCGTYSPDTTGTNWWKVLGDGTTYTASLCNPGTADVTDPSGLFADWKMAAYCAGCDLQICVAGNDDGPGACNLRSQVSFCTEAGREYLIVIQTSTGGTIPEGAYELTIVSDGIACTPTVECGPANDNCEDRILLVPDAQGVVCQDYDTTLATTDGPPNPPGLCNDSGATQTANDIWYNYQAVATGLMWVDTCADVDVDLDGTPDSCGNAQYDSDLVVYGPYASQPGAADCDPAALLANLAGCNDDRLDLPCGSAAPWNSAVDIPVTEGEWYKIRVGGWDENNGDVGPGTLHVAIGSEPVGACCVDTVCIGDTLTEGDCLAQAGCLIEWKQGALCTDPGVCALPAFPCDPNAIGGMPQADGENGVRPSAGNNNGQLGVAEDLVVCETTTAITLHTEYIDLTSPVGSFSAITDLRVAIYDASAGFYTVDPSVAVPICDITVSTTNGTATKSLDCAGTGPLFGGDVECWDATISCNLTPGTYLVLLAPVAGNVAYFQATGGGTGAGATGAPNATSPLSSQIFGIDPGGAPVFGGASGQFNTFCLGD